jgi:hypothetical protein
MEQQRSGRRLVRMWLAYKFGGGFVLIALFLAGLLGAILLILLLAMMRLVSGGGLQW